MKFVGRCSGTVTYDNGDVRNFGFSVDDKGIISGDIDGFALEDLTNQKDWFEGMLIQLNPLLINPIGQSSVNAVSDFVGSINGIFAHDDNSTSYAGVTFSISNSIVTKYDTFGVFPTSVLNQWLSLITGYKAWSNEQLYSSIGGMPRSDYATSYASGDWWGGGHTGTGRTWVIAGNKYRIKQSGLITKAYWRSAYKWLPSSAKLIILRNSNNSTSPPSGTWSVVGTSSLSPGQADTINSLNINTPINAQIGDYVGLFLQAAADSSCTVVATPTAGYQILGSLGDFSSGGNAIGSYLLDNEYNLHCTVEGPKPYLAVTGDSIVEGHNTATRYHSFFHSGFEYGGNVNAEPGGVLAASAGLKQQNHALGNTTLEWVISTGLPSILKSSPRAIWVHSGVNDIFYGRSIKAMLKDVATIRSMVDRSVRLIFTEILPWNGTDVQAGLTRQYNAELANMAADNFIEVVKCHSAFGQFRASTGFNDDLKAVYNSGDNVHLSTLGVSTLAKLVEDVL